MGNVRGQRVPCRFCGGDGGDGRLFGDCTFLPLVEIRILSFIILWSWISLLGLGAHFGMVGYPCSLG